MEKETCVFCRTIYPNVDFGAPKWRKKAPYCHPLCPTKTPDDMPRYRQPVHPACVRVSRGIFESFVAEAENSVTVFGSKTFDTMYNELNRLYMYLDQEEYIEILDTILTYENKYGSYIDLVLNQQKFYEVASTGQPKALKTPSEWTTAIKNLHQILVMANQAFTTLLTKYLDKNASIHKKKICVKRSASKCTKPCVVTGRKCTYLGHPSFNK
jgi:hypothetical protein